MLIVKTGCCQSLEVLGFSQRFRGLDQNLEVPNFSQRFRGLGTTSLLIESVLSYASHLLVTSFFASHDELNTSQLLHMPIMYAYIS
jgi:hypothetical protein